MLTVFDLACDDGIARNDDTFFNNLVKIRNKTRLELIREDEEQDKANKKNNSPVIPTIKTTHSQIEVFKKTSEPQKKIIEIKNMDSLMQYLNKGIIVYSKVMPNGAITEMHKYMCDLIIECDGFRFGVERSMKEDKIRLFIAI